MKQQDCRRSKAGDDQHSLAGVNETDIIADKVFRLLSMVQLRERFFELGIPLRIGPADFAEAQAHVNAINTWFAEDKADTNS